MEKRDREDVSIPSNRVLPSVESEIPECLQKSILSQSPQIGSYLRLKDYSLTYNDSYKSQSPQIGSYLRLKCMANSKGVSVESQSPQIGSYLRLVINRTLTDYLRIVSIPSNRVLPSVNPLGYVGKLHSQKSQSPQIGSYLRFQAGGPRVP